MISSSELILIVKHRYRFLLYECLLFRLSQTNQNSSLQEDNKHKNSPKIEHLAELIELNNADGKLHVTESLDLKYIDETFSDRLFRDIYRKFICELKCGHLESTVTLIPSPYAYKGLL